jgi:thiosulfate/3-mercaptopyruvate sulfurtransferase
MMPKTAMLAAGFALAVMPSLATATPEGWKPLLSASELSDILSTNEDVRVIRVSGDYTAGHIPGAVWAPYAEWRGPETNPGQLPSFDDLEMMVLRLGVNDDTPVVLVHNGGDQTDMGTATRVYWTLKTMGVEDLAVLNGGFEGWKAAGLEVSTANVEPEMGNFVANVTDEWRVTTEDVTALVESGDARLVDARPSGFFEGIQWSIARPGTLKGAENLTYDVWFDGTEMVGPDRAREIAAEYGQTDAPVTVSFCNTGHWASLNWFALSELAGVPDTKLYAESMAEWTQAGGALDNEPSRVAYYWLATKKWVSETF